MLVKEARTIQNRFQNSTNTKRTQDNSAHSFTKLMWQGRTQAVLKMLSKDYENGVLKIYDNILTELKSIYLRAVEVKQDSTDFALIRLGFQRVVASGGGLISIQLYTIVKQFI